MRMLFLFMYRPHRLDSDDLSRDMLEDMYFSDRGEGSSSDGDVDHGGTAIAVGACDIGDDGGSGQGVTFGGDEGPHAASDQAGIIDGSRGGGSRGGGGGGGGVRRDGDDGENADHLEMAAVAAAAESPASKKVAAALAGLGWINPHTFANRTDLVGELVLPPNVRAIGKGVSCRARRRSEI
jgi:hypothetical protein